MFLLEKKANIFSYSLSLDFSEQKLVFTFEISLEKHLEIRN